MPRDIEAWAMNWRGMLADGAQENLHAQAHARQILHDLETPVDEWPRFRTDLDTRLVHAAHAMLVAGLDFHDANEHKDIATSLLSRGAESLEYAVATLPTLLSVPDESLKAAVAYHIAGHHARAYVLSDSLTAQEWSDALPVGLLSLLRRDFLSLVQQPVGRELSESKADGPLAEALLEGALSNDDALTAIGHQSLLHAINLYVEFVKRGRLDLLDEAQTLCRTVAELGRVSRHTDLWWWGRATEHLLRELCDSSLWHCIGDLGPDTPYGRPVARYITGALNHTPCTVSLWPSQRKALELVKAEGAPSFCVRMPTSAGKTKIAELAIVRAILDAGFDNNAKCLYIAPFRSLAVEIEASLSAGLKPLGIRVSEVYGGFDLTAHDERLIADTQVLVATPEKLDATLRLAPELLDDVKLVVIDEGHIAGDLSERGIRAEVLFTRLLRKLGRDSCRHLFVSAVLPNPSDFSTWIAGTPGNLVESDWRPARLALGEFQWNDTRVRIDIDHDVSGALEEAVFVSRFIEKREVRGMQGVGQRRRPFPSDGGEAFAATAIRFAILGTTLAFVPQSRHVESTADRIYKSLRYMRALAEHDGRTFDFPTPDPDSENLASCLKVVQAELGTDSVIELLIRSGIAVHHGSLPGRVRVAVERLIRDGEVRLIVATTTLGQGVNLPIRTVLFKGLQQGQNSKVDPMTIWNIAGRAGRAMRENEGFVLFFNDTTRDRRVVQRQRRYVQRVIERTAIADVIGMLHRILKHTRNLWQQHATQTTFEDLCMRLAEDDFDWLPEGERSDVQAIYELVDQHLLALAHEASVEPGSLDALQEILRDSLLFAQLDAHPIEDLTENDAVALLDARVASVYRRIPKGADRTRFYRMGLSLSDCEFVTSLSDDIRGLMERIAEWDDLEESDRLDLLIEFAELALQTSAVSEITPELPENVTDIIRAWLKGKRGLDIVNDGLADALGGDPGKTGRFLEDLCVYGLAWVLTAFVAYARETFDADENQLPPEFELVPAMFKNGVSEPLAAVFTPYLEGARNVAMHAAQACPHTIETLDRCIAWLQSSPPEALLEVGLDADDVSVIVGCQRKLPDLMELLQRDDSVSLSVSLEPHTVVGLERGVPLILTPENPGESGEFDLHTLRGETLGTWELQEALPLWTARTQCVTTTVTAVRSTADSTEIDFTVERIA